MLLVVRLPVTKVFASGTALGRGENWEAEAAEEEGSCSPRSRHRGAVCPHAWLYKDPAGGEIRAGPELAGRRRGAAVCALTAPGTRTHEPRVCEALGAGTWDPLCVILREKETKNPNHSCVWEQLCPGEASGCRVHRPWVALAARLSIVPWRAGERSGAVSSGASPRAAGSQQQKHEYFLAK